jgi:hypothetical protein
MRSVFDLHLRSTLLRGARTSSDDDAPPPASARRALGRAPPPCPPRYTRREPHAEIAASDRTAPEARTYIVSDLRRQSWRTMTQRAPAGG